MSDFREQQRNAAANIRSLKETCPYIFVEWQKLEQAKQNLRDAQRAVKAAKASWDALGKAPE